MFAYTAATPNPKNAQLETFNLGDPCAESFRFRSPNHALLLPMQDALEWCLHVQELLMWQHWSPAVLGQASCREVLLDEASGLPLFRGPR